MVANGQEITITIDGKNITTSPGKTVLEAALDSQIYIPYLCYHPGMKPFAACRMCMVREEVEMEVDQDGQKVKQKVLSPATASCALPVRDGMVIKSNTEEIRELQTDIMEMVIAEHPHGCLTCHRIDLCGPGDICLRHVSVNDRCVTCPKNERCELKDTVRFLGMDINSPLNYQTRNLPVENGDPFYDRDYNLCIVCARCVRVCEEVRGDNAITFLERAGQSLVGTSNGTSLMQSGCEFCGACIDVCPVGALVERDNKWEKATNVEKTICNLCPAGCQLNFELNQRNKMIRVIPELNSPVNKGQGCFRGKFGSDYVNKKRNTTPKVQNNGIFTEIELDKIINDLSGRIETMSPDQTVFLVAPNISNESAYVTQKFARSVLKTNNIITDTDISSQYIEPLINRLGFAASTNTIWNIEKSDCILVINANITEEYNLLGLPIKSAQRNGSKLITIDSRETETTSFSDKWIRPKPGSETILLQSIIKKMITLKKTNLDEIFQEITPLEYIENLSNLSDETITQRTGICSNDIDAITSELFNAKSISLIYASDNILFPHLNSYVNNIIDLTIVSQNVFVENGGIYPLSQGSNQQGIIDMGCRSEVLPGHQLVSNQESVNKILNTSGSDNFNTNPIDYNKFVDMHRNALVKNIFIVGDIESFSENHIIFDEKLRNNIDNLITINPSPSEKLNQISDYIVPTTLHTEESGTFTNLERRVQISDAIIPTSGNVLPIWNVLSIIASKLSNKTFNYNNSSDVMNEISSQITQYKSISYAKLNSNAKVILKPAEDNPLPTQLLHSDRILIGLCWPAEINVNELKVTSLSNCEDIKNENDILKLIPGRVLSLEGTEIETNPFTNKNKVIYEKILTISLDDATNLSLSPGDRVNISFNDVETTAEIKIDPNWHNGFVSCTDLFAEYISELEEDKTFNPMLKPGKLHYQNVLITKIN